MMMMVSAVLGGWLLLLKLLPFESSSLKQIGPINDRSAECASEDSVRRRGASGQHTCSLLVCSWTYLCCRIIVYFSTQRASPRWILNSRLERRIVLEQIGGCKRNFTVLSTVKSYAMYYTTSSPLWSCFILLKTAMIG